MLSLKYVVGGLFILISVVHLFIIFVKFLFYLYIQNEAVQVKQAKNLPPASVISTAIKVWAV